MRWCARRLAIASPAPHPFVIPLVAILNKTVTAKLIDLAHRNIRARIGFVDQCIHPAIGDVWIVIDVTCGACNTATLAS